MADRKFERCLKIPSRCKYCGGKVLPVVYGMTTTSDPDQFYQMYHRKVILAGCIHYIDPDNREYAEDPEWQCEKCHFSYYSKPIHFLRGIIGKMF